MKIKRARGDKAGGVIDVFTDHRGITISQKMNDIY